MKSSIRSSRSRWWSMRSRTKASHPKTRWQEFAFPRRSWARRQFGYPQMRLFNPIGTPSSFLETRTLPTSGLRFHVSTYGMYGFAILSSTDFRRTMAFAVEYHQLAAPLVDVQFSEQDKVAVWTMSPFPFPQVDAPLYKFIVELQTGVHVSLHRDIMGQSFGASGLQFTFGRPRGAKNDVG